MNVSNSLNFSKIFSSGLIGFLQTSIQNKQQEAP